MKWIFLAVLLFLGILALIFSACCSVKYCRLRAQLPAAAQKVINSASGSQEGFMTHEELL